MAPPKHHHRRKQYLKPKSSITNAGKVSKYAFYYKLALCILLFIVALFLTLYAPYIQKNITESLAIDSENEIVHFLLDTWDNAIFGSRIVFKRIFGNLFWKLDNRLNQVFDGLRAIEDSVQVKRDARIAIGFGSCTDLVVDSIDVFNNLTVPKNPKPHSSIESMQDLLELFAYYFKHGAASERYIKTKSVFDQLLQLIKQSKSGSNEVVGGNGPIMSIRFVREGIEQILLGAQMSSEYAKQFPSQIQISGPFIERNDYHVLLEYKRGQQFGPYTSLRANRLIVHNDDNNAKLISRSGFIDQAILFDPNLLIISGLQMMDNSDVSFEERAKAITNLGVDLQRLQAKINPRIHFELASYTENRLVSSIVDDIFPHIDSFGLNEQEVANMLSFLKHGNISLVSSPFPRIALVLDQMRELFVLLNLIGDNRVSRIHVHTLAYQVVMVKINSTGKSLWPSSQAAMAKASLTAFRHTCGADSIDGHLGRILLDDSFTTSQTMTSKRRIYFDYDQPTQCWTETISNDLNNNNHDDNGTLVSVQFCLAIGLVCNNVIQTGGAGDNVSASGLVLQI